MVDRETILAAIQNRANAVEPLAPTLAQPSSPSTSIPTYSILDEDHPKRQKFRSLLNPGIAEHNSYEVTSRATQTLFRLSKGVVDHPEGGKYFRFKTTNPTILKDIVEPKGSLEYAVELGFRPEVVDHELQYVFRKSKMGDLLIGHEILIEFNELRAKKERRLQEQLAAEKAAIDAQKEKIRLAFLDDRKTKMQLDERERQVRAARATKLPSPESEAEPAPAQPMPGIGRLLSGAETLDDIASEVSPI